MCQEKSLGPAFRFNGEDRGFPYPQLSAGWPLESPRDSGVELAFASPARYDRAKRKRR